MKIKMMMMALVLTTTAMANDSKGGGGGDASEARVNEIRSDILSWIEKGGAQGLTLPAAISLGEYEDKMKVYLQPKFVGVTFVEKDSQTNDELSVMVAGKPKTCRGFFSKKDQKPNIICNIERFKSTSESQQYRLIHHEFAGLAYLEQNSGADSDYTISEQITDYLRKTEVLRLGVKPNLDKKVKTITDPGLPNGLKIVGLPTTLKMKLNIKAYIDGVVNCALVTQCGELEEAVNNFSAESHLNGVCKSLGYDKAVGHTTGEIINPFGDIVKVDGAGILIEYRNKEKTKMPKTTQELLKYYKSEHAERRSSWSQKKGAVDYMMTPVSSNVITSINCL